MLFWIVVVAAVIYGIIYVFAEVAEKPLPPKITQLIWIAFAIFVMIMLITFLTSSLPRSYGLLGPAP
jgi:hypothetical protein